MKNYEELGAKDGRSSFSRRAFDPLRSWNSMRCGSSALLRDDVLSQVKRSMRLLCTAISYTIYLFHCVKQKIPRQSRCSSFPSHSPTNSYMHQEFFGISSLRSSPKFSLAFWIYEAMVRADFAKDSLSRAMIMTAAPLREKTVPKALGRPGAIFAWDTQDATQFWVGISSGTFQTLLGHNWELPQILFETLGSASQKVPCHLVVFSIPP